MDTENDSIVLRVDSDGRVYDPIELLEQMHKRVSDLEDALITLYEWSIPRQRKQMLPKAVTQLMDTIRNRVLECPTSENAKLKGE